MRHDIEELAENFALFDNWEDRYRYLIDLGRTLPPMEEGRRTEERLVRGCTSRVWMDAQVREGIFHFTADSDAHIVRGLIALLAAAYQGMPAARIGEVDIEEIFQRIGLNEHLSPNRRNGFFAMVERLRALAGKV